MNSYLFCAWALIVSQGIRFGWLTVQDARNAPAGAWVTTEHLWPFLALALASLLIALGASPART